MAKILKPIILFLCGGGIYYTAELVWRQGNSNYFMIIMGGILFLLIGGINEHLSWDMPLLLQAIIGALMITAFELVVGLVANVYLGLNYWDYSYLPFNFMGQICLSYSLLWILVAGIGVILDDCLRFVLFDEEKPHYKFI